MINLYIQNSKGGGGNTLTVSEDEPETPAYGDVYIRMSGDPVTYTLQRYLGGSFQNAYIEAAGLDGSEEESFWSVSDSDPSGGTSGGHINSTTGRVFVNDGTNWIHVSTLYGVQGLEGAAVDLVWRFQPSGAAISFPNVLTAAATATDCASKILAMPLCTPQKFTFSDCGVIVSTVNASTLCQILVWDSDTDGKPDLLLWASSTFGIASPTGVKYSGSGFEFEAGRMYWIGAMLNGAGFLRCSVPSLGLIRSETSPFARLVTINKASAALSTFHRFGTLVGGDMSEASMPIINFKI